jgi:hypothetical protein
MFKNWLRACADFCDLEKRTLVPALLIIHQIQDGQIEKAEAINLLKSVTNCDSLMGEGIFDTVARYRKQSLTYRKWIITSIPYPSTAHFEYLSFGKRCDKRSRWSRAGNKAHEQAFKLFKSFGKTRITDKDVAILGDTEIDRIVAGAICSFTAGRFESGESDKWFVPQPSEAVPPANHPVEKPTHRSRANAARHNAKRFANWISGTDSPRMLREIRAAWDSARWDFKSQIQEHLGEERLLRFLAESEPERLERY